MASSTVVARQQLHIGNIVATQTCLPCMGFMACTSFTLLGPSYQGDSDRIMDTFASETSSFTFKPFATYLDKLLRQKPLPIPVAIKLVSHST